MTLFLSYAYFPDEKTLSILHVLGGGVFMWGLIVRSMAKKDSVKIKSFESLGALGDVRLGSSLSTNTSSSSSNAKDLIREDVSPRSLDTVTRRSFAVVSGTSKDFDDDHFAQDVSEGIDEPSSPGKPKVSIDMTSLSEKSK